MPFPPHGSGGFSFGGPSPPSHGYGGGSGFGLSSGFGRPFGHHGHGDGHHTDSTPVYHPQPYTITAGYYNIANAAEWWSSMAKHPLQIDDGWLSKGIVTTGSLGRHLKAHPHENAGDFIKSTGFKEICLADNYEGANAVMAKGHGWTVIPDERNQTVKLNLLGGEPVVIEFPDGKQIIGLDDFGLPSWTDYPYFYSQSEHPLGGHRRYVSWKEEYGIGKRVPWKVEPVEFTEADWRKQFGTTAPMPKGFRCYRILNADQPSDGWFYYPPTISVDDVRTPGHLMYGNLVEIRQGLMADISSKRIKLPDGYDFAYDPNKADQLGMFHFGG